MDLRRKKEERLKGDLYVTPHPVIKNFVRKFLEDVWKFGFPVLPPDLVIVDDCCHDGRLGAALYAEIHAAGISTVHDIWLSDLDPPVARTPATYCEGIEIRGADLLELDFSGVDYPVVRIVNPPYSLIDPAFSLWWKTMRKGDILILLTGELTFHGGKREERWRAEGVPEALPDVSYLIGGRVPFKEFLPETMTYKTLDSPPQGHFWGIFQKGQTTVKEAILRRC